MGKYTNGPRALRNHFGSQPSLDTGCRELRRIDICLALNKKPKVNDDDSRPKQSGEQRKNGTLMTKGGKRKFYVRRAN